MINVAYAVGRILLSVLFIVAGIQKLMDVKAIARTLETFQVPVPEEVVPYLGGMPKYEALGYLVGAVEAIGGLMVLIGLKARWAALVLVVFPACAIYFAHHFWDMQGAEFSSNLTLALKNLSIMGGLLLVVAAGPGPSAMDSR
jgi:putative oxidoreductase